MSSLLMRLGVLALVAVLLYLLVRAGRWSVEARRRQALNTEPLETLPGLEKLFDEAVQGREAGTDEAVAEKSPTVRILAFSSDDCRQCHQLQEPALRCVQEKLGQRVSVIAVDAPASPELTRRYHILTVPSTVVLDAQGHARAVNYGFVSTGRLLQQVDEALAKVV